jgi:HEAT repeat protein
LKDACLTIGSRDRLKVLAESLNCHPDIGNIELKQYLDNFGWEALSGITDLLGQFDHRRHREALCDYLTLKGRTHPDIVAKGIYDKRWYVVRNSVSVLARIGDDTSLKFLNEAVRHQEPRVRKEIAIALRDSPNVKALEILGKLALDQDPDIRREAINTLVARRGQAAFDTVVATINDDRFPEVDHNDQTELLRAFSRLGGDAAVGYLGRLILKYNPLRNKTCAFYRRAAFEALSYNRSERAEKLLVKLASNWRSDIRRQAAAALQRRRELMYAGTTDDS